MDGGWTDGRTDEQNYTPFYMISSPVGAAALLLSETSQLPKKLGKETADLMMPFCDSLDPQVHNT